MNPKWLMNFLKSLSMVPAEGHINPMQLDRNWLEIMKKALETTESSVTAQYLKTLIGQDVSAILSPRYTKLIMELLKSMGTNAPGRFNVGPLVAPVPKDLIQQIMQQFIPQG